MSAAPADVWEQAELDGMPVRKNTYEIKSGEQPAPFPLRRGQIVYFSGAGRVVGRNESEQATKKCPDCEGEGATFAGTEGEKPEELECARCGGTGVVDQYPEWRRKYVIHAIRVNLEQPE
jgi:hypothetical protein